MHQSTITDSHISTALYDIKLLHVCRVYIFRLQEKINSVQGMYFCTIIFPSYNGTTPYGYSIFHNQLKSTYAVHDITNSGKHGPKSSTTYALFSTPRLALSLPARSEQYRDNTVSCTHDLTAHLSTCLTNIQN